MITSVGIHDLLILKDPSLNQRIAKSIGMTIVYLIAAMETGGRLAISRARPTGHASPQMNIVRTSPEYIAQVRGSA